MTSRLLLFRNLFAIAMLGVGLGFAPAAAQAGNTTVRMTTSLGDIDIELFDSLRPLSVNNFLNYVNDGDYEDGFVHRSVTETTAGVTVIQGGGFTLSGGDILPVPTDPPIQDTPGPSNLRGTIAMAEDGNGDADSQWFINVLDNVDLDANFTVFGEVIAGLDVVDAIAAVTVYDASEILNDTFTHLPLLNSDIVAPQNLVYVSVPEPALQPMVSAALATLVLLARGRRVG